MHSHGLKLTGYYCTRKPICKEIKQMFQVGIYLSRLNTGAPGQFLKQPGGQGGQ